MKEHNTNLLFISEEEPVPIFVPNDKSSDNVFTKELLNFTSSCNMEDGESRHDILKIVEDKDQVMDEKESSNHELVQSAQGIVTMNSNTSTGDFEELENFDNIAEPHEAINHTVEGSFRRTSESHNEESEGIVDILGQIHDIVGLSVSRLRVFIKCKLCYHNVLSNISFKCF